MSKQCKACGNALESGDICQDCASVKFCLQCGTKYEDVGVFCGECGTKRGDAGNAAQPTVTQEAQPIPAPTPPATDLKTRIKRMPWYVWAIAAAAIIFIIFNVTNVHKSPESITKGFITALDKKDREKLMEYSAPDTKQYIDLILFDMPKDATIEIIEFGETEYEEANYAYVEVIIHATSKSESTDEEDTMYIEAEKIKNKWYIADFW